MEVVCLDKSNEFGLDYEDLYNCSRHLVSIDSLGSEPRMKIEE